MGAGWCVSLPSSHLVEQITEHLHGVRIRVALERVWVRERGEGRQWVVGRLGHGFPALISLVLMR